MKNKRHEKLLELIKNNVITTQDELQSSLENLGFLVTQSTVSRDIKELRIIKSHDRNGVYRYMVAESSSNDFSQNNQHYRELFSRAAYDVLYSMNTVIVKCYAGMASGACVAIDNLFSDMILGSLAGDDTIFAITDSEAHSIKLTKELKKLI